MSTSNSEKVIADLICGALFFAMRSCEYTDTPAKTEKKTDIIEVGDILFYDKHDKKLKHNHENLPKEAHWVAICFRSQKNGEKNEIIINTKSGSDFCPVKIWSRIITRLWTYPNTNKNTKVNTCYIFDTRKLFRIKSSAVTKALQNAVDFIGPEKVGITISSVGTHSVRTSFAMFMTLNNEQDSTIQLQGRWKSSSFLKYIRNYVNKFSKDCSSSISNIENEFVSLLHKY